MINETCPKWFIGYAVTLALLAVMCFACGEPAPPKPFENTALESTLKLDPPVKAAYLTVTDDGGELCYRYEINQETIDRLMWVPGITNVRTPEGTGDITHLWGGSSWELRDTTGGTTVTYAYPKIYELQITKAKAYTWIEIEGLLELRGLLQPKPKDDLAKF